MAVGTTVGGSADALSVHWNGVTWAFETIATPADSVATSFSSVSCSSATHCVAVGDYENTEGVEETLAEHWDGAQWTLDSGPPVSTVYSALRGVACISGGLCTAVGDFTDPMGAQQPFAQRWNGTEWTLESPSVPLVKYTNLRFQAVACTADASCVAVGHYVTGSGSNAMFAESWNGTTWSISSPPVPHGGTASELEGVECASATSCDAVGDYTDRFGLQVTLSEQWNGTSWAVQPTRNATGPTTTVLQSAACSSAVSCTAVGDYVYEGSKRTLVEVWNGTAWKIEATPNPSPGSNSALSAVACASLSMCAAAGSYQNATGTMVPLAEIWNGAHWAVKQVPPHGSLGGELSGVSCTSPASCMAVGERNTSSGGAPISELWNGTSWTAETTPAPTGDHDAYLTAIWCSSSTPSCIAIGDATGPFGRPETLTEYWDGAAWSIQPKSLVFGRLGTSSISCISLSACQAVGQYASTTGDAGALAMAWDGTSWTQEPTPHPTVSGSPVFAGVACSTVSSCDAVGWNTVTSPRQFAAHWNGSSWSASTTTDPSGTATSSLNAVACPSSAGCVAVGEYSTDGVMERTLAEVGS